MLTQLEMSGLNWIFLKCSAMSIMPLTWVNGVMYSKHICNSYVSLDSCIWFFLISTLLFQLTQFPILALERNINGCVLLGSCFVGLAVDFVCKFNIRKHKLEIVALTNEILRMNKNWGINFCYLICFYSTLTFKYRITNVV